MGGAERADAPHISAASALESLPLELLRLVIFFCTPEEAIFVLPAVSRRLHSACHDVELVKRLLRCQLKDYLTLVAGPGSFNSIASLPPAHDAPLAIITSGIDEAGIAPLINRIYNNILSATKTSDDPLTGLVRWIILVMSIRDDPLIPNDLADFRRLLRLMQYLPHAFLVELPLRLPNKQRNELIEFIAHYFLDVSGGPGFRSRLYSGGLDVQEINLRMAFCLTWLIMQHESASDLFRNVSTLGDQSLSSCIGGAILFTHDYLWLNNLDTSQVIHRIHHRVEMLLTIMGFAVSMPYHRPVGRPAFPTRSILHRDSTPTLTPTPLPFDLIPAQKTQWEVQHTFSKLFDGQRTCFAETEAISSQRWCGFYIPEQKYDLRAFVFSPPLRNIQFHVAKITQQKWSVISEVFQDGIGESRFSGYLEAKEISCTLFLDKVYDNSYKERWRGHLSPFGISGSYYIAREDSQSSPGGLFWLWIDDENQQ